MLVSGASEANRDFYKYRNRNKRLSAIPAEALLKSDGKRGRTAGGAEGIRTPDPHNAIVVLYQLSYDPSRPGP